jgi:hypothetical protein
LRDRPRLREFVVPGPKWWLDSTFSGDRSVSLRNQFPDAWYDVNNPDTVDPAACMPFCR